MLNADIAVIGLGNPYRRDDGVGVAVAHAVGEQDIPGVRVLTDIRDSLGLIEAWSTAALAVLVDAAVTTPSVPGRIRRCTVEQLADRTAMSSHGLDITEAVRLAGALGRTPGRLAVVTVDAADIGHGEGLTAPVAAAVPDAAAAVLAEIAAVAAVAACRPEPDDA